MSVTGVEEGFKEPTHAVPHFLRNVKLSNGDITPLYTADSHPARPCCSLETAQCTDTDVMRGGAEIINNLSFAETTSSREVVLCKKEVPTAF